MNKKQIEKKGPVRNSRMTKAGVPGKDSKNHRISKKVLGVVASTYRIWAHKLGNWHDGLSANVPFRMGTRLHPYVLVCPEVVQSGEYGPRARREGSVAFEDGIIRSRNSDRTLISMVNGVAFRAPSVCRSCKSESKWVWGED